MNANMPNMNAVGGAPIAVGAPMMMNNGAVPPQGVPRQLQVSDNNRAILNTYIYEYFVRYGMFDCARVLLNSDSQVKVSKDSPGGRRDENGNILGNGLGDDPMDTDSKDEMDQKRPEDLPAPLVPMPLPDSCFLYEWFCLFWDMLNAQKGKGTSNQINQYVSHTQQQSRMRQMDQQNMLRQMRPDFGQQPQNHYQAQLMRSMNVNGGMNVKQGNQLQRAALANSQNNPQAMQMLQQKAGQMQRDPSNMDDRMRPASPGSSDNAPSPSKKIRLDGPPFPQQGGMMPNGRPAGQGMPGQQVGNGPATAHHMPQQRGSSPQQLNPENLQAFSNQSQAVQAKTIANYAANLQQHHGQQMPNKPMPNVPGPPGQGSPMVGSGDPTVLNQFYNAGEMPGPGGMRAAPGAAQATGSNHALQDYQMQLMLLEQQNKKRLMMARQEQDINGGANMPRPDGPPGAGGPGAPPGPNAQPFPGTSPQSGNRGGASPNPVEQMKRAGQPMNMGSPLPEGAQNRASPNPAINFMGSSVDPMSAPHFFKGVSGMEGNMMPAGQMNPGMRPPTHPGQPFNGAQMNPQQMMARQQQAANAQGNPQMQWQQGGGPNGNQGPPQNAQAQPQGTPQQRAMPPPAQPAAANAANSRNTTSSPQTSTAAPPTPQQSTKNAPKKKDTKNAKGKAATQKKSNSNLNSGATPAADAAPEPEPPTPATPITPVNPGGFNPKAPNAGAAPVVPNGQPQAPVPPAAAPVPPQSHPDQGFNMDPAGGFDLGNMDFANPLTSSDVLNDFDFDSFLHDGNGDDPGAFAFDGTGFSMDNTEGVIGAE